MKNGIKYTRLHNAKVVQTTNHQDDVRYGTSMDIQCSCMSLNSVTGTLFKSTGLWDELDLDCILSKDNQLFKFIWKFRYLGMERLSQEFLIENSSVNVEFLENREKLQLRDFCYLFQKLYIVFSKL